MTRQGRSRLTAAALVTCSCVLPTGLGQQPGEFVIRKPSSTGIPGINNVLFVEFGPDGRLWTAARDAFWQQGGVAALDLDTGIWDTWSTWQTTLPQWNFDVAFATDGTAWIVGDDGVHHFDGETFTSYGPHNSVLKTGPHTSVAIDPDGVVWVANNGMVSTGGGLFAYDGEAWVRHHEPWMLNWAGQPAPAITVFARANGDVWATMDMLGGGLSLYRDGAWTYHSAPSILGYAETPDGTLYGVNGFGTYRLNDQTGQWQQIGPHTSHLIRIDPQTNLPWVVSDNAIGYYNTVYRYTGSAWVPFVEVPGDRIHGFDFAPDGDVWITARFLQGAEAIYHYTRDGQLQRAYNSINTGVPDYMAMRFYIDRSDHMWFITENYGATRYEPENGENYRNFGWLNMEEEVFPYNLGPGELLCQGVGNVYEDSRGNTWLVSNGAARSRGSDLSQWDIWYWRNSPLPSGFLSQIGEDKEGGIYIGGDFVAYKFDGAGWSEVIIGNPQQFAHIGFHNGMDGELYAYRIATVYRWEEDTFVPVLDLGNVNVGQLVVGPDGRFWMAAYEGLKVWDGQTVTTYTPQNSGMAETPVESIAVRDDGLVAVATTEQMRPPYDGGVALFDGETWTAYNYGESALPFYSNPSLTFDADGDLWMSTLNYGAVELRIGRTITPGDTNCDGAVGAFDVEPFILALTDPNTYAARFPNCDIRGADADGNGVVDAFDIEPFVALLFNP